MFSSIGNLVLAILISCIIFACAAAPKEPPRSPTVVKPPPPLPPPRITAQPTPAQPPLRLTDDQRRAMESDSLFFRKVESQLKTILDKATAGQLSREEAVTKADKIGAEMEQYHKILKRLTYVTCLCNNCDETHNLPDEYPTSQYFKIPAVSRFCAYAKSHPSPYRDTGHGGYEYYKSEEKRWYDLELPARKALFEAAKDKLTELTALEAKNYPELVKQAFTKSSRTTIPKSDPN